ncbi:hypothetical protein PTD2_20952 [Pseudoalteromonas tunicata D2]|uniref:Uncharacterized protein n=1 Tax=Pseudoalteromonas tunicata D2 TaxID=87626 RepID=A4CAB6_9GAMM|nr:hypothetical protein PTD2_20952 [Pseudoalteromonas tunicata D2]
MVIITLKIHKILVLSVAQRLSILGDGNSFKHHNKPAKQLNQNRNSVIVCCLRKNKVKTSNYVI